jgi:hypothetical protein
MRVWVNSLLDTILQANIVPLSTGLGRVFAGQYNSCAVVHSLYLYCQGSYALNDKFAALLLPASTYHDAARPSSAALTSGEISVISTAWCSRPDKEHSFLNTVLSVATSASGPWAVSIRKLAEVEL